MMAAKDSFSVSKTIVLVGLMGAGKTFVGKRLSERLGVPFVDADAEIETAAGCAIEDVFERYGEAEFREGERRVIRRLLAAPIHVLATGGGAYMDAETRLLIHERGTAVWLRADIDLLVARVARRNNRPLLKKGDPRQVLEALIAERYPIYAEADIVVDSVRESPETTVKRVIAALRERAPPKTDVEAGP